MHRRTENLYSACFSIMFAIGFCFLVLLSGCISDSDDDDDSTEISEEENLLNQTFRIDLKTVSVVFDIEPVGDGYYYLYGNADLTFVMRPDQTYPVIHFDPQLSNDVITGIALDNEELNFYDQADVRILSYEDSSQRALEFQRTMQAGVEHHLHINYALVGYNENIPFTCFCSTVFDIQGFGNEEIFPTINTPHELARHTLTFRVHSDEEYRCIGSGIVTQTSNTDIQEWTLDTEREVASYTVMFVVMPSADTTYEQRIINNVPVSLMTYTNNPDLESVFTTLSNWLPELESNLGPFPMPHGLSIFLTNYGGGMEYYGGTITSRSVLEHEVFHMYFGCSTIARTYRDSWWDEAINIWYAKSVNPNYGAISDDYRSDIVSGRSPIAVGFDSRAYNEGAHIMQAVAEALGGRDSMINFLHFLHQNYSFAPFTTIDMISYLEDYAGIDMYDQFIDWLYNGEEEYTSSRQSIASEIKRVDMTPPEHILSKYGR